MQLFHPLKQRKRWILHEGWAVIPSIRLTGPPPPPFYLTRGRKPFLTNKHHTDVAPLWHHTSPWQPYSRGPPGCNGQCSVALRQNDLLCMSPGSTLHSKWDPSVYRVLFTWVFFFFPEEKHMKTTNISQELQFIHVIYQREIQYTLSTGRKVLHRCANVCVQHPTQQHQYPLQHVDMSSTQSWPQTIQQLCIWVNRCLFFCLVHFFNTVPYWVIPEALNSSNSLYHVYKALRIPFNVDVFIRYRGIVNIDYKLPEWVLPILPSIQPLTMNGFRKHVLGNNLKWKSWYNNVSVIRKHIQNHRI